MVLCEDLFEKLEWAEHTFVDREFGLCKSSSAFSFLPSSLPAPVSPQNPLSHHSFT